MPEEENLTLAAGGDAESEAFLGFYDILVLVFVLCAGAYYIFFRKRKSDDDNIQLSRSFTIAPTLADQGADDSFIAKMKTSGRSVVAFYGSQTGTAEEFAGRLVKEAGRYGLKGMVADPEESDMEELSRLSDIPNSLAIFCMATYGEGEPTDNSQAFNDWLKESNADLKGMNYVVFGLGNKTYEHYNAMGIYVDKRLEELGATRIYELGLGDDDGSLEEDFISWKENFWPKVCEHFGLDTTATDVNMRQYKLVVPTDVPSDRIYRGEVARLGALDNQRGPFDVKNPFLSLVTINRELHKAGDRSCMHIELDISGSKIRYETGDHVAVYPTNNPESVDKIGKLLDVDLDELFSLVSIDEDSHRKHPFPCPCSYRTALTHYLDITCLPYTHVLKEISDYASDPKEKEMLKLMGSSTPEGKTLYQDWVHHNCRNIVQILEDLPSLKPPLEHLCELLPRLQSRYYSISSSPKISPERIHITAVLVEYATPTGRTNKGVATSWLSKKRPDNGTKPTVPIFVRKSQFRLPAQPQTPIIMIGPGTGLAPFRGFIQERNFQREQGKPVGDTILYFGCRKASEDYLYEDEIKEYMDNGTLTNVYLAFSRDQKDKVYVSHLLRQNAEEVWKVVGENNGHIYICGDARNMARDVHNIIKDICMEHGKMSDGDAVKFIKKMEFQKRYSADVWS